MRRSDALAVTFIVLTFVVQFHQGVLFGQVLAMEDIVNKFFSMRAQLYPVAHGAGWSLWNPLPGLGMPRLGLIENGCLSPVSLLFYALPTATVFTFYPVVVYSLAGGFTYSFIRTRGGEPLPALFGALAWPNCGQVMMHAMHPPIIETLLWLPATLTCWNLWLSRGNRPGGGWGSFQGLWLAGAALTFTFQMLGGFPQYILYDALLMAAWFGFDVWRADRRGRVALGAVGVLVVGVLLAAWQMLPALELARVSQREFIRSEFSDQFRFSLWEAALSLCGELYWILGAPVMAYGAPYLDHPDLSVVVVGLAALTLVWGVDGKRPWAVWGLVVFCMLGTLGSGGPVTPLLGALIPFAAKLRASSRFVVPAALMLSWLAAFGLQGAMRRGGQAVGVVAVAYLLVASWQFMHHEIKFSAASSFEPPAIMKQVAPRIAVDLAQTDQRKWVPPFDVNAGLVAGVPTLVFEETLVPTNYFEGMFASQFGSLAEEKNQRKIDILISTFNKFPLIHPKRPLIRAFQLSTLLHYVDGRWDAEPMPAVPHWFVVPRQRALTTRQERWAMAASDGWDPLQEALTEQQVELPAAVAGASTIQPTTVGDDFETLQVRGPGGILVTSALMYPGWTVRVDGQPAAPLQVDIALRGVVIGPGDHVVEWRYQPPWAVAANACTVLGLLGLAALSRLSLAREEPP